MPEQSGVVSFDKIINALLDAGTPFPAKFLHRFSDMNLEDTRLLADAWSQVIPERRANLLHDLEDLAESDTIVSFGEIARLALHDQDPIVRANAIRLLWEDKDPALAKIFCSLVLEDPDVIVRAAAARALGVFVLEAELDELSPKVASLVEKTLLEVIQGSDLPSVRRNALETLGYSSRLDVPVLIQNAYDSGDVEWMASALCAMGRSADPRWERIVLTCMKNRDRRIQVEAIRASGELELTSASPYLVQMLSEPAMLDDDVRAAAIWSLSQTGGEKARHTLQTLLNEAGDDDEVEYITSALDNLSFNDGLSGLGLFDIEEPSPEDFQVIMNPDEEGILNPDADFDEEENWEDEYFDGDEGDDIEYSSDDDF